MHSVADVLITGGWQQGRYGSAFSKDVHHCLVGAIRTAHYLETRTCPRYFIMNECTILVRAKGFSCVETWNDSDGRTFDEVLKVAKELDEIIAEKGW